MKGYELLKPILFCLPPEVAHDISLKGLKYSYPFKTAVEHGVSTEVMGLKFPNKIGLAAGLDKNAEYIDGLVKLGFGHIEVGTVTPKPQLGNPKPRLFRLKKHRALINRMGFNNKGLEYFISQIKRTNYRGILGINIGKNAVTPVESAVDDYVICLRRVYQYASYVTINISSPNTEGLRNLQFDNQLGHLLSAIKEVQQALHEKTGQYKPIAVKVAPDLSSDDIKDIAVIIANNQMDAVIATNTTVDKSNIQSSRYAHEAGGLSGMPLTLKSRKVVRSFREHLPENIPIIGVGGISNTADAKAMLDAGAELIQLYTGLIYQGPKLIKEIIETTNQ